MSVARRGRCCPARASYQLVDTTPNLNAIYLGLPDLWWGVQRRFSVASAVTSGCHHKFCNRHLEVISNLPPYTPTIRTSSDSGPAHRQRAALRSAGNTTAPPSATAGDAYSGDPDRTAGWPLSVSDGIRLKRALSGCRSTRTNGDRPAAGPAVRTRTWCSGEDRSMRLRPTANLHTGAAPQPGPLATARWRRQRALVYAASGPPLRRSARA